jgi:hypothetical protein
MRTSGNASRYRRYFSPIGSLGRPVTSHGLRKGRDGAEVRPKVRHSHRAHAFGPACGMASRVAGLESKSPTAPPFAPVALRCRSLRKPPGGWPGTTGGYVQAARRSRRKEGPATTGAEGTSTLRRFSRINVFIRSAAVPFFSHVLAAVCFRRTSLS